MSKTCLQDSLPQLPLCEPATLRCRLTGVSYQLSAVEDQEKSLIFPVVKQAL